MANNGTEMTNLDLFSAIMPTASGQAFFIGDLMYWDGTAIRPMSYYTGSGTAIIDQEYMNRNFAGVAGQAHLAAETTTGRSADPATGMLLWTNNIMRMACDSTTFIIGDFVGIKSAAGGVAADISDQTVVKVTQPYLAIGRVVARYPSATTSVLVQLWGRNSVNGPNQYAAGIFTRQQALSETLADSAVTLTLTSRLIQVSVPTAARTITLPAVGSMIGMGFIFVNNSAGANSLTIQNAGATSIVVVPQNKRGIVFSDGTTWFGYASA